MWFMDEPLLPCQYKLSGRRKQKVIYKVEKMEEHLQWKDTSDFMQFKNEYFKLIENDSIFSPEILSLVYLFNQV